MMESYVSLQLAQTARICHYRESKGNISNGQKSQGYSGEDRREKEEAVGCAGRTMTDERVALERFARRTFNIHSLLQKTAHESCRIEDAGYTECGRERGGKRMEKVR